jgi:secretion/DNA translocation related TadE-like protein
MKRDENGAMVVWMAALCAIALAAAFALTHLGNATVHASKVQNAADAASLSAAYEIAHHNDSSACSAASVAAKKNGARVTSCEPHSDDVTVKVVLINDEDAKAQSRAEID